MSRVWFLALAVACTFFCGCQRSIRKGEFATLKQGDTVQIINPDPIDAGGKKLQVGDACVIRTGGTMEVRGYDPDSKDFVVVVYNRPKDTSGVENECHDGTAFIVSSKQFTDLADPEQKIEQRREAVRRLLKK